MQNLKTKLLILNHIIKILRTPNSELRTCSTLFFILWIALLLGCGYQLVGKETHVPPGLTSVAIPTFINQTHEPGIEVQFTQAFLTEFITDRRVKVLGRAEADSVLEGVLKQFYIASVSYGASGFVLEYQTTVTVDVTLKRRTGEVLWTVRDFTDTQWYRASSSGLLDQASQNIAIQQSGRSVADRLRARFFHNF